MSKILLNLDGGRIKEILGEAYDACGDILKTEFIITKEEFTAKIDPFLKSHRVSEDVSLILPSEKYPELLIEINLKKKKIIARMASKNIRIHLNRVLTSL